MAINLKALHNNSWHVVSNSVGFWLMDERKKQEYLNSKKTSFLHEMCATLDLAYKSDKYSGLSHIYPTMEDITMAGYMEKNKVHRECEKKYGDSKGLKKILGLLKGAFEDYVWFLSPLEGSFCRVYVADFVANNTPFMLRCAKMCAACWLRYNELYYGRRNNGSKDAKILWNSKDISDLYLILIDLGMGAWLNNNLETVCIIEKEELKMTLGRMHEISGDLARIKEELGSLDRNPNKREMCALLFAHMARVAGYLVGLFGSQEEVLSEAREFVLEHKKYGTGRLGVIDKTEKNFENHKKMLEKMVGPLEIIGKNLASPKFPVEESAKDFKLAFEVRTVLERIEEIAKERAYQIYELRALCLAFHGLVHSELGYLNSAIKKEQCLY